MFVANQFRVAHDRVAADKHRFAIAIAERRKPIQRFLQRPIHIAQRCFGVNVKRRRKFNLGEFTRRDRFQTRRKFVQVFVAHGETRRHRMTAMPDQQIAALIERGDDVELADTARRAATFVGTTMHRDGWAIKIVRQPARDQTDDALGKFW